MLFRYLFYIFLIYLLYRLVFYFIIPVYKTTKQVKKQFHEMHNRMQDHMTQQQQTFQQASSSGNQQPDKSAGDYIDFEEVK